MDHVTSDALLLVKYDFQGRHSRLDDGNSLNSGNSQIFYTAFQFSGRITMGKVKKLILLIHTSHRK